ncbi:GNAT family N-acetyltransferase [Amycolatopsis regifaucium]|uniref:GCN5 family acetyltransferase n=1 Tax=Amycolatopsis regifaucium TaxID=546365 RepID=A0A154M9D3_9PSEU|nr:GNAT family N-acetyltransferase [Amycolatopsis regifaucium]KZB80409.1 GCN5 family acetyltransferase [Amycolatopsis regifaucium]OKA05379.1 GNAT family N-acetyltransferase [Amycolatopsis regifaucium]SFJ08392.1 phosphinothricin acetyltransferase [Amycolatopsis regifaucium]
MVIREATEDDAAACAEIYAPYVTDTVISFETEPPKPDEMAERITKARRSHAWLVLEDDEGRVIGYAYAGPFSGRPAYRWSCEVSVYLERGRQRKGGGRALYQALLDRLASRGFRNFCAGMVVPNDASAGLHKAMGFEPVGTYKRIGYKHGAWWDVAWMQLCLPEAEPVEPR